MNNYRLLTLVSAFFFTAIGITAPMLTLFFAEELMADKAEIARLLTTVVAITMVGSYAWGWLSDKLGRRKPLLASGIFGVAITSIFLSQAPTFELAWVIRLCGGFAAAAYTTLSLAIMTDILAASEADDLKMGRSSQKGRRMGLYRGLGSFSFAVGAILGGRLADAISIRAIFILCALLYALAALTALAIREEKRGPVTRVQTGQDSSQSNAENSRLPLLFLVGVSLWTMAHMASASMWPNFMREIGYTKTQVGAMWGLAAFIEFPAMFLAGMLSDLTGTVLILASGGFFIAIVNFGYLTFAHYFPALVGIQIIRGFGFGTYTTSAMTFTGNFGGTQARGRTSGLFYVATSTGHLAGAYMGGTLAEARGFGFMYGFCAISALMAGLCFLVLRRTYR